MSGRLSEVGVHSVGRTQRQNEPDKIRKLAKVEPCIVGDAELGVWLSCFDGFDNLKKGGRGGNVKQMLMKAHQRCRLATYRLEVQNAAVLNVAGVIETFLMTGRRTLGQGVRCKAGYKADHLPQGRKSFTLDAGKVARLSACW